MKKCVLYYLDEVEILDEVDTDDDVDTELDVEILKWNRGVIGQSIVWYFSVINILTEFTNKSFSKHTMEF